MENLNAAKLCLFSYTNSLALHLSTYSTLSQKCATDWWICIPRFSWEISLLLLLGILLASYILYKLSICLPSSLSVYPTCYPHTFSSVSLWSFLTPLPWPKWFSLLLTFILLSLQDIPTLTRLSSERLLRI